MRRGMTAVFLAAFLLIPAADLSAQGGKGVDGTVWKQLNADNKALFTLGYFTGIQVFAKYAPGSCSTCQGECLDDSSSKLVPLGTSIPKVVESIDSIYADPANAPIPVQWSLKIVASKAAGMSDEEFKAAVDEARAGSTPEQPAAAPPAEPGK